jgi:type II secretory pathway pseudopilin PulG
MLSLIDLPKLSKFAFTLLELLITMALMIILFVALWSPSSKAYQQQKLVQCHQNLQNLSIALKLYAMENGDVYPRVDKATSSEIPLDLLVPKYTSQTDLFICPGSDDELPRPHHPLSHSKISYSYYRDLTRTQDSTAPLMSDEQVNPLPKLNSGNVRWRIQSTGISHLEFNDREMLY